MSLVTFSEHVFQNRVNTALNAVRTILDNSRNPQYPTEVQHEYDDKYLLAEFLTNSSLAAHQCILDFIGVSSKPFTQMKEWAKTRSVTLRFQSEERCKFLKTTTRDVESDTKHVTKAGIFGKFESGTVTKVTEHFWQYSVKWELVAFVGVEHEKGIVLQSHNGSVELKTSVESSPKPEVHINKPLDVNITWILQNVDDNRTPTFTIDRKSKECRTPRRNPDINKALNFYTAYYHWAASVTSYFVNNIFQTQQNVLTTKLDFSAVNDSGVFVPVLPLFEASASSSKIPPVFMNSFLAEQARSLEEKRKTIAKIFSTNDTLASVLEASLVVELQHANHVSEAYSESVDYIENMLHNQLIAAIGKVVTPVDFANYLTFHNRKIFGEGYRPQPFSYAIRRPLHSPEGTLSITAKLADGSISTPIASIVSHSPATRPMYFSINEATKISFLGDRYLHGFVSHQFAGQSGLSLTLNALARQFSSFILVVGRIVSATQFDPKYAIIIQNKDELKIPLMLETIPTPKEFKDAIASLSPEQQRFCKAFRSMQLESTLFGVCVLQIKPQLEKVLKLPEDSLTKEIQLTQDLLNMFIKYQIPTDLVSYDGPEESIVDEKIGKVKEYVERMKKMLDISKKDQLGEAQLQQQMRVAQLPIPPPPVQIESSSYDMLVMPTATLSYSSAPMARGPSPRMSSLGGAVNRSYASASPAPMLAPSRPPPAPGGAPPPMSAPPPPPPSASSAPPPPPPSAPSPSTPPPPSPAEPPKPEAPKDQNQYKDLVESSGKQDGTLIDYTKVPTELEQKFDKFDESNALRPTIINTGSTWTLQYQKSLLNEPETKTLNVDKQEKERNKAFDLLDALTKSGVLTVEQAALHVVIASTHCFDKSIIQTVVQDNINPIEKVENSSLIVASIIHRTEPANLIAPEHLDRIRTTSALLLTGAPAASNAGLMTAGNKNN